MSQISDTRPSDWMRRSNIEGFAALVVGGGSGMGEASAKIFAANGGLVVVADLNEAGAKRVAAEITAAGGRAVAVAMNISVQGDIEAAVKSVISNFGKLDVLINTAVLVKPASLEDCSLDDWHACFRVNVDGALLLARACLPHLRKSSAPAIVNVASLAGVTGYARTAAYGPSKAALITLSRQMALEWAADGIRVNVVIPGTVDTPLTRHVRDEVLLSRAQQIPLGRLGLSSELGDLMVYLASPAASFITGQTINCDGGFSQNLFAAPMGLASGRG